jgi:L-ribulose-5-phosphate 4-epimerase
MNTSELCVRLNKQLYDHKITLHTWGNVSVYDSKTGNIYIKPSGVSFDDLTVDQISIIDHNGKQHSGLKPSVDTPIHNAIYKAFPQIRSILHTHSKYTTIWCQCRKNIPILGTTHADYFPGPIPVLDLPNNFDFDAYETNLGNLIVNYFIEQKEKPERTGAVLLANHGVFVFSDKPETIIEKTITLEFIAELAMCCEILGINHKDNTSLFNKHFERKHGVNKYYGQS